MKLGILVVTYGADLSESNTLKSLCDLAVTTLGYKPNLTVWVNKYRTENTDFIKQFYDQFTVDLVLSEKNESLSVIYNKVMRNSPDKYCVLLDQDSMFDLSYLQEAQRVIDGFSDDAISAPKLMLPKVFHGEKLVSPGKRCFFKGYLSDRFKNKTGNVRVNNMLAINSGVVVATEMIKNSVVAYDENLNFYFTDTKFLIDYGKKFKSVYLLASVFEHDLSEISDVADINKAIFRFDEMNKGFRVTFKHNLWRPLLEVYLFIRAVKLSVSYKNPVFIKKALNSVW